MASTWPSLSFMPLPRRPVVRDLRVLVHGGADPVADVLAHHREPGRARRCPRPRRRRRRGGGPPPPASIAASSDRRVTSMSRFDSSSTSPIGHGDRGVGVPALDDRPAVDREDVAVVEHDVVARDAVHDHVVGRRAHHRGEPVVPEEVRPGAAPLDHLARRRGRRRAWSRPAWRRGCTPRASRRPPCPARRIERDLLGVLAGDHGRPGSKRPSISLTRRS